MIQFRVHKTFLHHLLLRLRKCWPQSESDTHIQGQNSSQTATLRAPFLSFAMLELQRKVASQEGLCVVLLKSECEATSGTIVSYRGHVVRPALRQLSCSRQNCRGLSAPLMQLEWQLWGNSCDLSFQMSLSPYVATCSCKAISPLVIGPTIKFFMVCIFDRYGQMPEVQKWSPDRILENWKKEI